MSGNPSDRILRARLGGFARAAKYSGDDLTGPARRGFEQRFLREVDPDNLLPEHERERRAEAARKAHMTKLALRSAQARRRAADARRRADALDADAQRVDDDLAGLGGDAA
jgi:hypothetical protein